MFPTVNSGTEVDAADRIQRINFLVRLHELVLANHFSEKVYGNFLLPVFIEVEALINEIRDLELSAKKSIQTDLAEILAAHSQDSKNPTLLEFSIDIRELVGILSEAEVDTLTANRTQLEKLWELVPSLAEVNPSHPNLNSLLGWYTGVKKDNWQASRYYFTLEGTASPLKLLIQEEQRLSVVESVDDAHQLSRKFSELSKQFVGAKKQLLIQQAKIWGM